MISEHNQSKGDIFSPSSPVCSKVWLVGGIAISKKALCTGIGTATHLEITGPAISIYYLASSFTKAPPCNVINQTPACNQVLTVVYSTADLTYLP